jgi:hypothetical protein
MKRLVTWIALALCLMAGSANAGSVGVGAYGGMSIPIVQDDNGSGPVFGLRVPVSLLSHVRIEPFFGTASDGDATADIGGVSYTRSGFDVTTFGATAQFPFGSKLQFYPFIGISSNSLKRPGSETQSMFGFGGGLGLGFSPAPKFMIHVRGEATNMSKDTSGRVFAAVTGGVSYELRTFSGK